MEDKDTLKKLKEKLVLYKTNQVLTGMALEACASVSGTSLIVSLIPNFPQVLPPEETAAFVAGTAVSALAFYLTNKKLDQIHDEIDDIEDRQLK